MESVQEGIRKSVEWAAVIGNTKTYEFISKSLLSRRVFPLAPDENMPNDSERYEARRGKVYLGKDIDLARFVEIFILLFDKEADNDA